MSEVVLETRIGKEELDSWAIPLELDWLDSEMGTCSNEWYETWSNMGNYEPHHSYVGSIQAPWTCDVEALRLLCNFTSDAASNFLGVMVQGAVRWLCVPWLQGPKPRARDASKCQGKLPKRMSPSSETCTLSLGIRFSRPSCRQRPSCHTSFKVAAFPPVRRGASPLQTDCVHQCIGPTLASSRAWLWR
ncbi:uncharacterized protein BKA78DRAFT_13349 [Phyllosticta capitalensis]|uniref:uncharacterized protein n=1 Tax=Phyllosticta capitalensis TaxID=121624 RepID=UPI00312F191B